MCLGGGVQADAHRGRVTWCGGWRKEGVSRYVGILIGGIGWTYGGPQIG